MQAAAPSRTSKSYQAARASLIASFVLSTIGFFTASVVGDQTPPYEASAINELAWSAFLLFGAASLFLGVIVSVWCAHNANRQA
jgi:hypothetical protein